MSTRSMSLSADIYRYLLEHSVREHPVLERLRAATADMPGAEMQISPEQGQFLALLLKLTGARRCIELGTYTGYSSLVMALALPPEGRLITCDVSAESTRVARQYWREAGVESRIELKLQPGLQTLEELGRTAGAERFDFAFVDADKPNYIAYYEKLLMLVRPGGLIAVDNTLYVAGTYIVHHDSPITRALRAFNDHVHHDERVDLSMVPIGEGLTLLRIR
ncbi:MAG TPA: class I SAM-dependent methyltransferase [Steroidobacteraceae bacterium]|nr:class I SAM-dependent methyltransferase [Steroidobacteraceae bacterium]